MRVFRHIFIELDENGKKRIVEQGTVFYPKVEGEIIECYLYLIKSEIVFDGFNNIETFTPYIKYEVDDESIYKAISLKDIRDGYKKDGVDVKVDIKYDYFILEDSFNRDPYIIKPGDKCYLADICMPGWDVFSGFNTYPCKYLGADENVAKFTTLNGDISINVDYRTDNRYIVIHHPNNKE